MRFRAKTPHTRSEATYHIYSIDLGDENAGRVGIRLGFRYAQIYEGIAFFRFSNHNDSQIQLFVQRHGYYFSVRREGKNVCESLNFYNSD